MLQLVKKVAKVEHAFEEKTFCQPKMRKIEFSRYNNSRRVRNNLYRKKEKEYGTKNQN